MKIILAERKKRTPISGGNPYLAYMVENKATCPVCSVSYPNDFIADHVEECIIKQPDQSGDLPTVLATQRSVTKESAQFVPRDLICMH